MNLFSFIDKYGDYSFEKVAFTEVDNVIMAMLSYVDLEGIVSRNSFNPKRLSVVGEEFFLKHNPKTKNIRTVKNAIKILRYIKDTKRYKDLLLYNYEYRSSDDNQFGALTIEINKDLIYVSFEGTDHLIGGWKEDFMMSYMFPAPSQRQAINYVNRKFLFMKKKIILGGHSKGGNLALVAGMYANMFVSNKIVNIYSNDGPGLLIDQFNSKNYQNIEDKLISIVPNYSVIGLLLNHRTDIEVIKSFRKSVLAHDATTWVVKDLEFERTELSSFGKKFDAKLLEWLRSYELDERKTFVLQLFDIFDRAKIVSLIDIMNNKKLIFKLVTESKELDKNTKVMLKDLFLLILGCFKDVSYDEVMSLFNKNS